MMCRYGTPFHACLKSCDSLTEGNVGIDQRFESGQVRKIAVESLSPRLQFCRNIRYTSLLYGELGYIAWTFWVCEYVMGPASLARYKCDFIMAETDTSSLKKAGKQ